MQNRSSSHVPSAIASMSAGPRRRCRTPSRWPPPRLARPRCSPEGPPDRHPHIGEALVVVPPAAQDAHDVVGVFLAVLLDVLRVGGGKPELGHHAVGEVGRAALRPAGGLVVRAGVGVEVVPVALRATRRRSLCSRARAVSTSGMRPARRPIVPLLHRP